MTRARDLGDFIADGAAAELVVDTTTLVVDSTNNRVGVGTASPATALDVTGTVTSDGLTVVGDVTVTGDTFTITSSAQDDPVLLIQNTTNDSNSARLKFNKDRGAAAQDGDDIADIIFAGENDAQQAVTYAAVRVEAADVSDGSEDGTIAFQSMKAGTLSDSLKIDSGGDVGIGVSPSNPGWARNLQVHGAGNGGGLQLTDNTSGSGNNDGLSIASYQGNSYFINRENAFTVFSTNDTERFRFGSAGQLGIGGATYGTSGQILTSGGSGAAPSWADAAGGGGQFDAVASGAISNGDPVSLNADGSVTTTSAFLGAKSIFNSTQVNRCSVLFEPNANKSVIAYRDNQGADSGKLKAVVATISGTTASYGTAVVAADTMSSATSRMAFDSNSNKVVIAFRNSTGSKGSVVVGTVSGTSISFGSVVDFTSYAIHDPQIAFDSNSNKIVVAFKEDNPERGKALVGTVSGTSISFGSEVTFQNSNCFARDMTFDSNSNKIVLIIKDDSDDDDGQALVGTVSGTSISFGTKVKFTTGSGDKAACTFDSNSNKVVIAFRDTTNSSYLSSVVGTVSGTSISFGSTAAVAQTTFSGQTISISFDTNLNKVIICFADGNNGNKGSMVSGAVSGTSISFGFISIFNNGGTDHIASAFDSSTNKLLIAIRDESSSSEGAGIVAIPLGIDNFTKWVGFASAAISNSATGTINVLGGINEGQSSLDVGSTYYFTDAAALSTTVVSGREVGKSLSATKLLITQGSIT